MAACNFYLRVYLNHDAQIVYEFNNLDIDYDNFINSGNCFSKSLVKLALCIAFYTTFCSFFVCSCFRVRRKV